MARHRLPVDSAGIGQALDEAPLSRFHARAVIIAGMGLTTDAYDLFVVVVAGPLIAEQWHLSLAQTVLVISVTVFAVILAAFVFDGVGDPVGRKRMHRIAASMMAVGAALSAFSPNLTWLVACRVILGIGVGGDYRVSTALMTADADRRNRVGLVSLVFSTQALGIVAGYLLGPMLMSTGVSHGLVWRLLLGVGAVPAACLICLRRHLPASSRSPERPRGRAPDAALWGGRSLAVGEAVERRLDDLCDDERVVAEAERIVQMAATAASYSNT